MAACPPHGLSLIPAHMEYRSEWGQQRTWQGRRRRPSACKAWRRAAKGGPSRGTRGGGRGAEGGAATSARQERREAGLGASACRDTHAHTQARDSKGPGERAASGSAGGEPGRRRRRQQEGPQHANCRRTPRREEEDRRPPTRPAFLKTGGPPGVDSPVLEPSPGR
jgi:hypothetical protein